MWFSLLEIVIVEVSYCIGDVCQLFIAFSFRCLVVCFPFFEFGFVLEQFFSVDNGVIALIVNFRIYYSFYFSLFLACYFDRFRV